MEAMSFNTTAVRKSVNLTINSDLLHQAKALNINLSQTLERHLGEVVQQLMKRAAKTSGKFAG